MTVIALASNNAELERRLANFLFQCRVPGRECIQLNVYGGVVAVSGRIPTRYAKWLCIECCRRVAGVIRVIDNVKIEPAVNERPTAVHIAGENTKCRRHRYDKSAICRDRPSVPFKRTFAASKCPKVMAAA
jgi:BON domain-containing protein